MDHLAPGGEARDQPRALAMRIAATVQLLAHRKFREQCGIGGVAPRCEHDGAGRNHDFAAAAPDHRTGDGAVGVLHQPHQFRIDQSLDAPACFCGFIMRQDCVQHRPAALGAPVTARHQVRRMAICDDGMFGQRFEPDVEQPVERVGRVVDRQPDDGRVRGAVADPHHVVEMHLRGIVNAAFGLQPRAGGAHLAARQVERAADSVGRLDDQDPRAFAAGEDRCRQSDCPCTQDKNVVAVAHCV